MRANVVKQIRQYHGVVTSADKTIADAGREQIRAAFKCGQLLDKEKAQVRSGHWGRFCKKCGMSEDTAGRYIKLSKSADLRDLIQKYRTLNSAYQGEGITSPQRQRVTITAVNTAPTDSLAKAPVAHHSNRGGGTNHDGKADSAPSNGGGNTGVDLKAKVKGGGTLGDLLSKVSPAVRADIESQLSGATEGGRMQKTNASTVTPSGCRRDTTANPRLIDPLELGREEIAGLFQGPMLIDALLLQLKQCAKTKSPDEIDACVSYLKPIVSWYEKYAAKAKALAA